MATPKPHGIRNSDGAIGGIAPGLQRDGDAALVVAGLIEPEK
jgi:hypothetical protein